MSEVQTRINRRFRPEDVGERDWWPTSCIKMSMMYKVWLRSFLMDLIRARVDSQSDEVQIIIDEWDFTALMEIINHFDRARLLKSSVERLTTYGGSDARPSKS